MKRFIGIMIVSCIFMASYASALLATPPSKIELAYDLNQKVLSFDISHVSHDVPQHRIRKVKIYLNDREIKTLYFSNQTNAGHLIGTFPLDAKPNDAIRLIAVCSDAGQGDQTLIVPEPEKSGEATTPRSSQATKSPVSQNSPQSASRY